MFILCGCSNWLEEKARNRVLEEQLSNNAIYEIEVKTGRMKVGVAALLCPGLAMAQYRWVCSCAPRSRLSTAACCGCT